MRDALGPPAPTPDISSEWGRVFVRSADPPPPPHWRRVFGISSMSVVDRAVPAELDAIEAAALELYPERVRGPPLCHTRPPYRPAPVLVEGRGGAGWVRR